MKIRVVFVVLMIGLVGAEDAEVSSIVPSKSPVAPSTATPAPEVTIAKSTTSVSTTASTTSTVTPPTSSSTPASTTTTSTPAPPPSTTTPQPPTTTTPKPVPKEFFWNVTGPDGVVCILAKADIKLGLIYTNESSKQEVRVDIPVPKNATSSGQCGSPYQMLQLSFDDANNLTFNFTESEGKYHLAEILSKITVKNGNTTDTFNLVSGPLELYDSHLNTSYVCSWTEPAILKEDDAMRNTTKASVRVTLKFMRFEAFRNATDDAFSKEYSCPMDSPDIVPVMVGIALGILVAVVLIAYLVGRRSTQAQGYLSM